MAFIFIRCCLYSQLHALEHWSDTLYQEYFGLQASPFKITPDTQLFYTGGERGLVLDALVYAVSSGEGIVKVVGEVGSGKTMLCRMLAERLPERIEVIYLANPRLTPDTILQAIALEMGLPVAKDAQANHLQVMQALHEALMARHAEGKQCLVLVEEAQSMPIETLEEIRLLSNLETTSNKLLQIVLFGQPELDDNLSQVHIRQLKERITHHFYLSPFKAQDTGEYLEFRLRAVGYRGAPVFSPAAVKALHKASQGLLRRINILADKSLLAAFAEKTYVVTPKHVRLAIKDSGFLNYQQNQKQASAWVWLLWLMLGLLLLVALGVWYWLESPYHQAVPVPAIAQAPPVAAEAPIETPQPVVVPAMSSEAESGNSLLAMRLAASRLWLQQADAQFYSLQIMETERDHSPALEQFLKRADLQPLLAEVYVYPVLNQDKQRGWGMLYGYFASREQAQAALQALPKTLLQNQPFVRTLASVQQRMPEQGF